MPGRTSMTKQSPSNFFAVLFAIAILGVVVEIVERQNPKAAWALVVILLLSVLTYNAKATQQQFGLIMAMLVAPTYSKSAKTPPPRGKGGDTGGGASFK